ncbi:PBECR2 nuclease fold domain-containing protein [Methylobacter sp. Wu1]|uniref:PBECR2 nuclease fold domain-containing protein n=1 Tax=Methylobacter sp. Wu1 TaxID=3119359 RepID=UPI002F93C2BA
MPLNLSPTQLAFNARGDGRFNTPFQEQLAFFQQKLNLPTEHYDDILKAAHDRAFVVAGAAKAELLADLRTAVDQAIADGKSIQWFRKEFKAIVQKHGWEGWTGSDTKEGRDWRTRVIYKTNLSASYAAGRWQQLNDPDLLKSRPYWKYVHNDTVAHPRPLHQSWSGLVLPHDDPWWQTHFPPNGWGCRCRVTAVRAREYEGAEAPDEGVYVKEDRNGVRHVLPNGVDYGWDYAPGAGLSPRNLSEQAMDAWRAAKADAWEVLAERTWTDYQRPAVVPIDAAVAAPGPHRESRAEVVAALRQLFGGDSKVYSVGGAFNYPVMIDAAVLGEHIDPARSQYLPMLAELLNDPFEVWAMFQRHKGTGKIEMRVRVIKRIENGDKEGLLLIAQAGKGQLEGWTFVPTRDLKYINKQRKGVLVYARQ